MGVHEEGAELQNLDGLCTDEASATKLWLVNFRKDSGGGATHIIWRQRPTYEWIAERWQPYKRRLSGNGFDWHEVGFERDPAFSPGGLIYSRLWFGRL